MAAAITVIGEETLPRLDASGNAVMKRALSRNPEAINRADCDADQQIRFPITLTGFEANSSFEVWASVAREDCALPTARTGASQRCWKLKSGIPLQQQLAVDIRVREILMGAPPFNPTALGGAPCGLVNRAELAVHFLYFDPGQTDTPASSKSIVLVTDTVGPPSPTGLLANPFYNSVGVRWDPLGNFEPVAGVQVYCARHAPAPGNADPNACALSPAFGPQLPISVTADFDTQFSCLSFPGTSTTTSGIVTGSSQGKMRGGERYVFTAAVVDEFGNPSSLALPACATVRETSNGCSTATSSSPNEMPSTLLLIIVVGVLVVVVRARALTSKKKKTTTTTKAAAA